MADEAQDFLDEVEYVYQEVHKLASGEADEEIKRHTALSERRAKQEEDRKQKELELQMKGKSGRGEKFGTYEHYCPRCQLEFTLAMPICPQCSQATLTSDERKSDLLRKVAEMKEDRANAAAKKGRWENWKKTEAMLYRKMATNYRKWDYFEDEADVEPELPFVPPEDPAFKELERDMEERRIRRTKDKAEAERLKTQGNDLFKQGNFLQALEKYEQAQQLKRDWMILYTNSAIVRIKVHEYQKAVEDCNRVLEYCEVFEDGYKRSPELCFKALTRRAMANRSMRKATLAVDDLTQALTLKQDPEAVSLLNRCREEARLETSEEETVQVLEEVTNAQTIVTALESESELIRFIKRGGYQALIQQVKLSSNNEALEVLVHLCADPEKYMNLYPLTKMVKPGLSGLLMLLQAISPITDFGLTEKVLTIVSIATENQEVREELMEQCANAKKVKLTELLLETLLATPLNSDSCESIKKLITVVANLCLTIKATAVTKTPNPGDMKDLILFHWARMQVTLTSLLEVEKTHSAVFALLCNLAVKTELRSVISSDASLVSSLLRVLQRSTTSDVLESGLGLVINCLFQNSAVTDLDSSQILALSSRCLSFVKSTPLIQQRAMLLLSRLLGTYPDLVSTAASDQGVAKAIVTGLEDPLVLSPVLKVMIQCCKSEGFADLLPHQAICAKVKNTLNEYEAGGASLEVAGNSALLICRIIDACPHQAESYTDLIPTLIETVGRKADIVRKNCALALGRLAKDSRNLEKIRELHGMDVLRSVAEFVLD